MMYLEKAFEMEEKGHVDEAIALIEQALSAFPEEKAVILLEKAKMEFRNGSYKEALLDFIESYGYTGEEEVFQLILEAYYLPNQDDLKNTFERNLELLSDYPYYHNEYEGEERMVAPIWQDEQLIVCVNFASKQFATSERKGENYADLQAEEIVLLSNQLWMEDLTACEEKSRMKESFMDMNLPVYLVFDRIYWELFAQLYDIQTLLETKRVVFLVGIQSLQNWFSNMQTIFPTRIYCGSVNPLHGAVMTQIIDVSYEKMQQQMQEVEIYYRTCLGEIHGRIRKQTPRVMVCTCRFTTALQYHARDCMEAAKRLGCDVRYLIEEDGLHRIENRYIIDAIAQFKPDIVLTLDHFRYEYPRVPKEIVWLTWIQDPMPHIMDRSTPGRLTGRDIVLSHFTGWKKFDDIGYRDVVAAPIPANAMIYKPYLLTEEEEERYSCDVCLVCHAADVDRHIAEQLEEIPDSLKESVCAIYKGYEAYVRETGELFYVEDEFALYIQGALEQHYQIMLPKEALEYLAEDMRLYFNQRVYRQVLVDWILEAGFRNIRLWGNGWSDIEKYVDYAMGAAQNGETLAKIYQASKIVIGNNVTTTSAARAWETMLSGGFYMSNYIPPEADITDIRKIVEVGKDVVMFHGREDLVEKLQYYLTHEEERQEMIKRGREAALKTMTYDVLMERAFAEAARRVEEYDE
ncbi:MAG: glycosyltransferase [Roseburia sp.]